MQALIDVIIPVFLVIGAGYLAVWRGLFSDSAVDGLTVFAQQFAIPCLLFRAIWTLDLGAHFDLPLMVSFYTGSITGFFLGLLAARFVFNRDWEDAVAIGFCCLFANSLLLGLAITERAYGTDALAANYAIVALHAPICYGIGITAMEIVLARGTPARHIPGKILKAMFRNNLVIAIALGFAFNLFHIGLPAPVTDALDMMIRTALPAALFAMGGVLYRYRPEGDSRVIAFIAVVTLVIHPLITWSLAKFFGLGTSAMRSAVVTASMAPGINAYVFANMYGRARRVAATSVLVTTAFSIGTVWVWLTILP